MELRASIHEDDDGMYWAEVQELPAALRPVETATSCRKR